MSNPLEVVIRRTASNRVAVKKAAQRAKREAKFRAHDSPFFRSLKEYNFALQKRFANLDRAVFKPFVAPIAGFTAAFAEISLLFPTEYCKVQLQLNRGNNDFCLKSHLRERGFRIYQALPPMLIGAPLQGLLRFSCLEMVTHSETLKSITTSPAVAGLLAGISAGVVESVVIVTPMETVKTKLIDSNKGLVEGIRHVVKNQGVSGLYNGLGPTVFKSATNQAIRFIVFNQYKSFITADDPTRKLSVFQSLTGGVLAGLIGCCLNTPIDTVKSRMQGMERERYKNSMDCVKQMIRKEGFPSLYKGLVMRSARVVPGQGIIFLVYDQVSNRLNKYVE